MRPTRRSKFKRELAWCLCPPINVPINLYLFSVLVVLGLVGCQTFNPFQASARKAVTERLSRQWNNIGLDALSTGRLSQAKSFFTRAAVENPQDQLARINLARTLRQEGDLSGAIEQMQQGLELSRHKDPKLIAELGEMLLDAGQWLPAQQQADAALKLDHRCAAAWALQGKLQHAKKDYEPALLAYHRAMSIEPNMNALQFEVAKVYQESGQPLKALSALEQLLQRMPPDQQPESALLAKADVLMQLEKTSTAMEVLQIASERDAPSKELLIRLASAQIQTGNHAAARVTINRIAERFPDEMECQALLAKIPDSADQVLYR